jgi:carboxymethylenebutenolidase
MCDNDSMDDMIEYRLKSTQLSRRRFGALTFGSGMVSLLPRAADAAWIEESAVDIKTPDGSCDAYFAHPAEGVHPGVLMWPDIFGLRPAFRHMARRLAEAGYAVMVPNPFYRTQRAPTAPENPDFNDKPTRDALMALMESLSPETVVRDAKAYVGWLDSQSAVDRRRRMGTMGYCMSGPYTLRTAAALPERIGAGASFHGGAMVTDKPDSPHLLVPRIKAPFLIAIASNDDQRQPQQKTVLREAFAKANVPAEIEVYEGALHGWCPPDSRVYNDAQAERAWGRMLGLFRTSLGARTKKA